MPADVISTNSARVRSSSIVPAPGVAHRRAQSAHQLVDHVHERALVRHAALDAFGHELLRGGDRILGLEILEVAVRAALLHRAERAHAAVALVRAALVELDLAGRLVGAGEQAAEHHAGRAGGDRLRDVAGVADAAVGDRSARSPSPAPSSAFCTAVICGTPTPATMRVVQIEPGPDADLDARRRRDRRAPARRRPSRRCRRSPARAGSASSPRRRDRARPANDRARYRRRSRRRPPPTSSSARSSLSDATLTAAPTRSRPSSSLHAFGCSVRLLDVLDGDEPAQLAVAVQHQHALEPVPVHQRLRRLEVGAFGHGHQPLARRHDRGDRLVEIRLEAQVAVGDDADDALAFDDRQARRCGACCVSASTSRTRHRRRDRDRILDDAATRSA